MTIILFLAIMDLDVSLPKYTNKKLYSIAVLIYAGNKVKLKESKWKKSQSVLQIICDRSNNPYFFDVRGIAIAVLNCKGTLTGSFYFPKATV